jgi:hypothetical protein
VAALGVAGGLALLVHAGLFNAALDDSSLEWLRVPTFWFAVPAVLVPLLAAGAEPRRFRIGVVLGWVLGAGGLYGIFFDLLATEGPEFGYAGLVLFGLTLPLLLVAALVPARARG